MISFDRSRIRSRIKNVIIGNKLKLFAVVALLLLLSIMLTGCGDGNGDEDRGRSRAEVEEIVQSAMAELPDPPTGLS